jgi:YD repeat-containing protein
MRMQHDSVDCGQVFEQRGHLGWRYVHAFAQLRARRAGALLDQAVDHLEVRARQLRFAIAHIFILDRRSGGMFGKEDPIASDLTNWKVHGPVRTLRIQHAEWDLSREEWRLPRHFGIYRFRPDGRTEEAEHHNPDGSVGRITYVYDDSGRLLEIRSGDSKAKTLYQYDEFGRQIRTLEVTEDRTTRETDICRYDGAGRKTKVHLQPPRKPGETYGYCIDGDESDDVSEIAVQDEQHRVVSRFVFERDGRGRPLSVTQFAGDASMGGLENALAQAGPAGREQARAAIASLFGPGASPLATTTYAYDEAGRLMERYMRMGELGGHRTTYSYDDNGREIANVTEHYSRRYSIDENGSLRIASEESHKQHFRFTYVFDAHGNWTERAVWSRLEPNPNFQPSNVERREIGYH